MSSEEELDEDAEPQPAAPPPPPAPAAEPQPGPAAQQLGTPLEQKIDRTRQLVKMLVRMRMNGVKSQGELAGRLGWSTRDLSNFMTGKSTHKGKTLDRTVLGTRAANLLSDLERCGFMTTTHCPRRVGGDGGRQAWGSEEGRRHRGRCAGGCASCGKARPQRCSRCASRRSGRRAGRRACCGAGQAQEGTQVTAWCLGVNVSLCPWLFVRLRGFGCLDLRRVGFGCQWI